MMLHILLNVLPCSGFVKKSAGMFIVGQNATLTLPFFILSAKKKYRTLMCRVLFELEDFPFYASRIVLLLSWYIVVIGTWCPCSARKCLVHSTWPIVSSTANNSASVEL